MTTSGNCVVTLGIGSTNFGCWMTSPGTVIVLAGMTTFTVCAGIVTVPQKLLTLCDGITVGMVLAGTTTVFAPTTTGGSVAVRVGMEMTNVPCLTGGNVTVTTVGGVGGGSGGAVGTGGMVKTVPCAFLYVQSSTLVSG